jgi:ergothioneine biosynthesis protein EgtB
MSIAEHLIHRNADDLAARYRAVRECTVALTASLEPEDFVVQSMPEASPTKWHLAHTSWFFENFLLCEKLPGYRVFHEHYGFLFNSYYFQVGKMQRRAERGLLTRPPLHEVMAYRDYIDTHMLQLIQESRDDAAVVGRVVLGLNHEQQHQELLLTDIKHAFSRNPLKPAFRDLAYSSGLQAPELRFIAGLDGVRTVGHGGNQFSYDNEGPAHRVLLHPYAIANRAVTNAEFHAFVEDGGYRRPELWLSDGWTTVLQQQWDRPFYWQEDLASEFTLGGVRGIDPHAPVSHVSYFEADAFARWAGARLPTEFEWETWSAACPVQGNFVDGDRLHPVPARAVPETGPDAKLQVFGDVWEWTASPYTAYPGYKPSSGAIGEYNGKFMCNQFVLRGGSCATHSTHIRNTYRNFFYPGDRWQFSGIRLARDIT